MVDPVTWRPCHLKVLKSVKGRLPKRWSPAPLFETEAGKVVRLWLRQSSGPATLLADLTGTPADGSVTTIKVAAANIDGAAGTPSMRSLSTDATLGGGAASDTVVSSQKAVKAFVRSPRWSNRCIHLTRA